MIQSPQDMADAIRAGLRRYTGGEADVVRVTERAFVSPPEVVVVVETVEGARFTCTVQHEPMEVRRA